ncbi:efflux RND transporter periplasmic adaptor subunit [Thiococcus pfennigii]|jgi:membrane fusion protein (multidrug efflux system)|uniref:efflux RND transporter periplasmic adaptor subunit n=1 Tax=Thiococcus pfennigii TaxID=1057 RepID=UPI001902F57D|nr:efflux RND transporter periplasmic adaptor subunit [Thiococcus pfennigii]MBK1700978.1 efflux transporter periplasmic adaptor subunit [Thiococcus pfennigii]MBK1733334.1 efflux transporter periplasmic adaptor subunit [Thiococcus pfennigii]
MIRRILIVFVILAVLVAGLGLLKYRQIQDEIAQFSQPRPAATVSATEVRRTSWTPRLHAVGSIAAVQGVMVNNEVPGQVSEILFESGAMVRRGDLLLQLDDAVDQADLAGLLADQELAEIRRDRNARLLKSRAVSQEDFDEISATLEKAQALVAAKQASIAKKAIRAPFDGQLGIRLVNLGQYLPAGSAIVPLQALDPVYVDFSLPERRIAEVAVGQTVEIQVAAYPERTFTGNIQAINPSVDAGSRNLQIRAELANPERLLRPGMFAEVATLLPTRDDVLTLPRQTIVFNTYGDSVLMIQERDGANVVQRRQIRTGAVRGEEVEVLEGLAAGDRVVLAGQVKLTNGQAVEIVPEATDAPAASAAP